MSKDKHSGRGTLTGGIIMVGTGLVFLLSNWGLLPGMRHSWPLILIIVGVALLAGAYRDNLRRPTSLDSPTQTNTTPTDQPT
ncbi:MAG TPA: DUF5668 domain-containing protein [candidate division Zixibacteria bacterium]|jgi:hypothetical protein